MGNIVLQPIAKRQGAKSTVRTREKTGGYTYDKGSIASLHGKTDDITQTQKNEMERK